jgi:membrane dipeptidase
MKKSILLLFIIISLASCNSTTETGNLNGEQDFTKRANELAHKFIITDGHVDLPYRMEVAGFMLKKSVEDVSIETKGNFDYPKAKRGGLDAPFMSIYIPSSYQVTGGSKEFADSLIDMVSRLPQSFPQLFALANSPQDVTQNFENGLISLPMGMENGSPLENDLTNVKYFFDRGIRYITLTHATDNMICDAAYDETEDTWNGLSPFGEEVVQEMNRVGIMVDVSHISDSAFYDVMRISKAPVIASHSSCRKFTPGWMRNMDDDMIKLLAENGGVICINFGSTFLSAESKDKRTAMNEHLTNYKAENNLTDEDTAYTNYAMRYAMEIGVYEDVETVANHIDHVVSLVGLNHVGFGSDFDGVGDSLPNGLKDVSMFPNLIKVLLQRGYTEDDIAKICYQNTFRVWDEVLKLAQN